MYTRPVKDIAATVRQSLKAELPHWKFSVRTKDHSSIYVSLMAGPERVMEGIQRAQLNHYNFMRPGFHGNEEYRTNGHTLTPMGWEVMRRATEILSREHWDKSEIQIDYFCSAFYMHVEIGQWDKPYQIDPRRGVR